MKEIVFNALQTSLSGGIGRYSYELAKELYNLHKIKIVIRSEDIDKFSFAEKDDLIIVDGIKNSIDRNIYEQFILPRKIKKNYPNAIIHYPDSMAPLISRNDVIITIHDLAFLSLKNVFTLKTVIWKKISTKLSIRKAKKIVCITNFVKNEVEKHYPNIVGNKIEVVYNGFNNFSQDIICESKIGEKIKKLKNEKYILTVSTISPRKNIDGLIEAFSKLNNIDEYKLVIAGKKGWMFEDIFKLVEELDLNNRIIFTNEVNDDELKYLYKYCNIFVYPSFYEGFGLPPLEAMSFGKACITSNITSLPEVVGNAAIKIYPGSVVDISKAIQNLLKNDEIRFKYENLSKERIKSFSWKKCSMNILEIYMKVNQ